LSVYIYIYIYSSSQMQLGKCAYTWQFWFNIMIISKQS
jgi:hypothetical protein